MYKHHVSIEGWENGWSDRENERKWRKEKAGDGGKPVCMLTQTQKAVHVCSQKEK